MGGEPPAEPVLFLKPSTAVCGHGDPIRYPAAVTKRVDYEGELAVVIGRLCREVPASQAAGVIFGYTCANDVTARDLQAARWPVGAGEGVRHVLPAGAVDRDRRRPRQPGAGHAVNGEVRQRARTSQLLHGVAALVAYASSVMTLLPGDVLLTGTPAGVGPLTDGDEVSVTIENIGTLTNPVANRD